MAQEEMPPTECHGASVAEHAWQRWAGSSRSGSCSYP